MKIFSTQKAIYRSFYILILKQQLQQIIVLIPNKERCFVVSYVIIVTFHPALNLDRIMIQRSYAHSIDQLTSLNYSSDDQMKFNNLEIIRQLKDIAIDVSKRKCKNMMGQMFCIKTALVKKTLLAWFNKKYKSQFVELSSFSKMMYEKKNLINWRSDKCVICNMLLRVEPTSYLTIDEEMAYGDFIIRYEHKFIRNIYTLEQIKESHHLKTIENYYEIYQKFFSLSIGLLSMFNNYNKNDNINSEVSEFIEENFADDSIDELKNRIMQTEIKNALSSSAGRVPKFNLKIYAFVYDVLVYFPSSDIQYETFTTTSFFVNVHHLIKMKIHLHHSHVTGKILGYARDFCNTRLVEKTEPDIPVIAHNLFGFDLYYFIKGYIASAWCSKQLNIGGNNLTQFNFSNITGKIKFIDSLKYYQKSLSELASTISDEKRAAIRKLTEQFFNQHYYFSRVWPYLNPKKKQNVLEIVSEGKGVIPYELIIDTDSFFLIPENDFWEKTELQ